MGGKQTKGRPRAGSADAPDLGLGGRRKPLAPDRGDLHPALGLKAEERRGRAGPPAPYQRRVGLIQDLVSLAKQGRQQEAAQLLRSLRQDLGMESTSLDDVLCRYASFRNLVDPITHELIISLARYIHCPKPEGDSAGGLEKICRQLTHHLSPHSQCKRQGFLKRKPQACLKAALSGSPPSDSVDLSGIALTVRDLQRVALYLQRCWETVCSVELGFTELTDEGFLQLLPTLASLPNLCNLSLNGNKLTRAILRELTDTLKDLEKFPSITWIDLGNNVDIYSLPQPFLVSLRRRCPKHGNLPTILEFAESQGSDLEDSESDLCGQLSEGAVPDQKPLLDMAARCDGSEGEGAAGETA
ncbi:leucine-rich repeat-containing protein 75A-like isoform X2 [Pristis pectinata]|uniref:leucine-rich repeat-containing protein 75A-like isoform X2 n=1 Tax=Pristis pectinata TaxID=685728 RepID=UPI00223CBEE7|nr:leucine-rich repeat-containing protein 75A-like isoform X2 [Pristis pectinata]